MKVRDRIKERQQKRLRRRLGRLKQRRDRIVGLKGHNIQPILDFLKEELDDDDLEDDLSDLVSQLRDDARAVIAKIPGLDDKRVLEGLGGLPGIITSALYIWSKRVEILDQRIASLQRRLGRNPDQPKLVSRPLPK